MNGVLDWLTDPANWRGPEGAGTRLVEHIGITAVALGIACLLALPLALWLGHIGRGGVLAVNISNVGRAIPTFALLVLLAIGPLAGYARTSTIVALVFFGIPPILTNTYVGVREVDRDMVESATGMGMSGMQVLRKVELPLATPLLMSGVRLAAVQILATATIAALVAGPGLGRIIRSGFQRQDQPQLIAGAILVGLLALVMEGLFALLQTRLDPVRRAQHRQPPPAAVRPEATGSAALVPSP